MGFVRLGSCGVAEYVRLEPVSPELFSLRSVWLEWLVVRVAEQQLLQMLARVIAQSKLDEVTEGKCRDCQWMKTKICRQPL